VAGQTIGEVLPSAIGVALSPIPIVAVILMLFSPRAKTNGPAFLAGWLAGLTVVGAIVLALAAAGNLTADESGETDSSSTLKLALGLLLLLLAVKNWRDRPREGDEPAVPRWMSGIDSFAAPRSFGLAFLLSAVNPKNLLLTIAAAISIAQAGLSTGEEIVVLIVFIVLASIVVLLPVLTYLLVPDRAAEWLESLKLWLVASNNAVLAVIFLIFGVKLIGEAIGGFSF